VTTATPLVSPPLSVAANRPLTIAIAVSIAFHAALLAVRFAAPETFKLKGADAQLEVVLVNAKSPTAPTQADVLAQVNMDGGGDRDKGRSRSPLPNSMRVEDGDSLRDATERMRDLEEEQKKLLSQLKRTRITAPDVGDQTAKDPKPRMDANELLTTMKAVARSEAQIDKAVEDYNKRPRVTQSALRAREYPFAQYVESWRAKIERIGTTNYPIEATRNKLYGKLRLTVYIRADGTVDKIELDEPSQHDVLNKAALRIVKMAGPYPPLPPDISKDTDILAITRTWIFTNETLATEQQR
jgi:protein TonB